MKHFSWFLSWPRTFFFWRVNREPKNCSWEIGIYYANYDNKPCFFLLNFLDLIRRCEETKKIELKIVKQLPSLRDATRYYSLSYLYFALFLPFLALCVCIISNYLIWLLWNSICQGLEWIWMFKRSCLARSTCHH